MTVAQDDTQRVNDINGWPEIPNNPISKVGVYPYLGKQISDELIPDKIYMVYRPKEELASTDCIESFKLQPIIDEHTMLGNEPGLVAAEKKGVHGVIGENVWFDEKDGEGVLKANLKVFSKSLMDTIDNVKKDISLGYRCVYELSSGIFAGVKYDAIQRNIRGNHLAIVHEGRMGREVAVLDHMKFTFDSKELFTMATKKLADQIKFAQDSLAEAKALQAKMKEAKDEGGLADLASKIETITSLLEELKSMEEKEASKAAKDAEAEAAKTEAGKAADADKDDDKDDKGMDADKDDDKDDKKAGMDAAAVAKMIQDSQKAMLATVAKRDELVKKLVPFIGTFDHATKTLGQTAEYAADKLGLKAPKGHELTAVETYLSVAKPSKPFAKVANDSKSGSGESAILKHVNQ